jgi:uncharacterized protein YraI
MSILSRLVLGAALLLLSALPAAAVQPSGSAGWSTEGWTYLEGNIYAGPGTRYGQVDTIEAGIRVRVDRCTHMWCEIHTKSLHGWMVQSNVGFGEGPWNLHQQPDFPVHAGGTVCFYSGHDYTGAETCYHGGHVVRDLKFAGLDNSFGSVKVGGGSVLACRDRWFRSYCVILNEDHPRIEGLLDRAITSIHVY